MEKFSACFDGLGDPRDDNARHNLFEILVIAFATILCGGEDCSDMALSAVQRSCSFVSSSV
jgi:hypothetical protein